MSFVDAEALRDQLNEMFPPPAADQPEVRAAPGERERLLRIIENLSVAGLDRS